MKKQAKEKIKVIPIDGKNIQTWICGHVHKNFDFVSDKNCRVVSNQKGKPRDRIKNFVKNFTIDL